jgi:hypothetical protein
MGLFDKEEIIAPNVESVLETVVAAVSKPTAVCTRDTRGEEPCAVKDCENCN